MLELVGNILNWMAAGVLFPLLLLPLAGLANKNKTASTLVWLVLVAGLAIAGAIFSAITPILQKTTATGMIIIFGADVAILAAVIILWGGPRAAATRLSPVFAGIASLAGRTVMWLLLAMALVQFTVVLLRYVFGINWILMQESITYMHGFVFLIAAGYALLVDEHVRVDIFYREASPKRKALADLLGTYFLLFPICLLIMWTASPYVGRSWLVMEGSADTSGIQGVFILKSLIPLFAVLLSMAGFVIATRAVETLRGRD